jgi:hypothetical protein
MVREGPRRSEKLNGNPGGQRTDLHGERASLGRRGILQETTSERGGERGSNQDEQSPG